MHQFSHNHIIIHDAKGHFKVAVLGQDQDSEQEGVRQGMGMG